LVDAALLRYYKVTNMNSDDLDPARAELLSLRARIVVLERAVLAALELGLRIRPEELSQGLEVARRLLEEGYSDAAFSPEVENAAERTYLAAEVEKLMRALQSELGHPGGIQQPEGG
jgi:hypothetical protein